MKTFLKFAGAVALTGAIALAAATPSEARGGRNAAAAIGFGAGAIVGAAAASSYNNGYYGNGYYAEPGYAPGYAYESGYAYEPAMAPVYVEPGPSYYYQGRNSRNNIRNCTSSPGSQSFGANC
jgi:hypothetical protein